MQRTINNEDVAALRKAPAFSVGKVRGLILCTEVLMFLATERMRGRHAARSGTGVVIAVLWRQLHHPNVLPFYGIYRWNIDPSRICLASLWMDNGIQYLTKFPDGDRVSLVCGIWLKVFFEGAEGAILGEDVVFHYCKLADEVGV